MPTKSASPLASPALPTPSRDETRLLREKLTRWCGVHLDQSKSYLVESRLRELLAETGASGYDDLVARAERADGLPIRHRIIDALTTHETSFFRDGSPFDAIRRVIVPEIRHQTRVGRPRLRVWSAACSSGQEPYSIALSLLESIPELEEWDLSILATDVSPGTVQLAKEGIYKEHEVRRGLNDAQLARYFQRHGEDWQVSGHIREMIRFRVLNLENASVPGPFELIFCRNVPDLLLARYGRADSYRHCQVPDPDRASLPGLFGSHESGQ